MIRNIETPPSDEQRQKKVNFQFDELNQYTDNIPSILKGVQAKQIQQLRQKYLYQLKKLDKNKQQYHRLKEIYDNLPNFIENSQIVQEQTTRINFIMKDTQMSRKMLDEVESKVISDNQKYKCYLETIKALKKQLKQQKEVFFSLKRQEQLHLHQNIKKSNQHQMQIINSKMKAIRKNKPQHIIQYPSSLNKSPFFQLSTQITQSFNAINHLKKNLLETAQNFRKSKQSLNQIKINQANVWSMSLKKVQKNNQSRLKKLYQKCKIGIPTKFRGFFNKAELNNKNYNRITFQQTEIQKQLFRKMAPQQILAKIIDKGKLQQVLELIEKQKKPFVEVTEMIKRIKNR